ncbi:uncharacterized protein LOC129308234 isoform X2 [Prosopis cineraria]|uniref:uncharacterized protein LOC129308234 isoform X2 n=1 Tax=Prosopis cineraria TaxID=364024 RepID=UPI00240F2B34|nr:uncharacterized protein LOC129308234 isoform X2 [Prosopis cineraria]
MNVGVRDWGSSGIGYRMMAFRIPSCAALHFVKHKEVILEHSVKLTRRRRGLRIVASSDVASPSVWDDWKPAKGSSAPSLSDIVWPSAGAFAAMALLGKMDQILAPKGLSMTVAPLGAVSAVLFATPSTPAARLGNLESHFGGDKKFYWKALPLQKYCAQGVGVYIYTLNTQIRVTRLIDPLNWNLLSPFFFFFWSNDKSRETC